VSTLGTRLDKVMPVLSAKERAILVLRSLKDKTPRIFNSKEGHDVQS